MSDSSDLVFFEFVHAPGLDKASPLSTDALGKGYVFHSFAMHPAGGVVMAFGFPRGATNAENEALKRSVNEKGATDRG